MKCESKAEGGIMLNTVQSRGSYYKSLSLLRLPGDDREEEGVEFKHMSKAEEGNTLTNCTEMGTR